MIGSHNPETGISFISPAHFTYLQMIGLQHLLCHDSTGAGYTRELAACTQRWGREESHLLSTVQDEYDKEMLTEFFRNLRSLHGYSNHPEIIEIENLEIDDLADSMIDMLLLVRRHFDERRNSYIQEKLSLILHKAFGV
jgi:hypothetical protein